MTKRGWRAAAALAVVVLVAGGALWLTRQAHRRRAAAVATPEAQGWRAVRPYTGPPEQVSGEVVDDHGRPIPGATVMITSTPLTMIQTDARGRFGVAGLPARKYTVVARTDQAVSPRATADLSQPDAPPVTLTLKLGRAATLIVTIVDSATGAAIPDADVVVRGMWATSVRTDTQGQARIGGLEVARVVVKAAAPRHATVWSTITPNGQRPDNVRLALGPGVSVSGRVLSGPDRGVSGATVTAERVLAFYEHSAPDDGARTNDDGRFVLDGVAPGRTRFRVTHPDFPDAVSATVDARPPAIEGLEIQLEPGQSIAGRVLDAGGRPVTGGSVVGWYQIGEYLSNEKRTAQVGPNGAFVLTGLHPGSLSVQASTAVGPSATVAVQVGPPRATSLDLAVDSGSGLGGRLVLPGDANVHGVPVAMSLLAARGHGPLGARVHRSDYSRTDGAGRFRAAGLAPGVYTVSARVPVEGVLWRAKETVQSGDAAGGLDIPLVPGAQLVGRALSAGGVPLLALEATVDDDVLPVKVRSGAFAIKGISPGPHEVLLSAHDLAPILIERVNLTAGQTLDVGEVRFMPARSVCGRVAGTGDGLPVQGARIVGGTMLVGDGGEAVVQEASRLSAAARTVSDPQGRFCLRRVGNGPVTISVRTLDGRVGSASVPPDAHPANVEIAVDRPGSLRGVVSSTSHRLEGMDVVVVPVAAEEQRRIVRLGPSGEFELQALAPGEYTVGLVLERAEATSQVHARRVVVPPGGAADVRLDVELGEGALRVTTSCTGVQDDWPAQVYVVAGAVGATTLGDVDLEVWGGRHPVFGMSLSYPLAPAWIPSLPPGSYSVCAARPAPTAHAAAAAAGQAALPIACLPVTVQRRPGVQSVTIPCS